MRHFPVFFDLKDKPVLVVGGGAVAARKIRALFKAGARVSVVSENLNDQLAEDKQDGRIEWIGRKFEPGLISDYWLVIAATDDPKLNRLVFDAGEERLVPVNTVDDTEHCRFISPAVVDREPVLVAISTGGASPMLARALRKWIEEILPQGLGKIAQVSGRLRKTLGRKMSLEQRRERWSFLFNRKNVFLWSTESEERIGQQLKEKFRQQTNESGRGKVYLVGAGPGRPELLTIRALEVLQNADVILHDKLVPDVIIDMARRDAERIDVGKRAGKHKGVQTRIHDLMVQHANQGKVVVRLKGGDAFIFGRGGEELQHLRAHGIRYEVVPGITAAIGCAAYAGIPLTHRDHAQSLTVTTGHLAGKKQGQVMPILQSRIDPNQTQAVYMGVRKAPQMKEQLLAQGMKPSTPVALIINGTRDNQQVLQGTISTMPALAAQTPDAAPGLFIIGEVAALAGELAWFGENQPVVLAA